ncbi:MAG: hypothetical protein K2Q12_09170 [Rickettsiales bacterium]|nr:hypothetical protein [Rickettsiales bacterium]
MALPLKIALQQQPLRDDNGKLVGPRGPVHLDPLHCELLYAIERGLTVREFVARHAKLYQFGVGLTKQLSETRFEHELAHLILGLAFMKLQRNPIPHDFGYDGNNMAEAWVINFESLFDPKYALHGPNSEFCSLVRQRYATYTRTNDLNSEQSQMHQAAITVANSEHPLSLFEARHTAKSEFGSTVNPSVIPEVGSPTKWGEALPDLSQPRDKDSEAIYNLVWPLAVKVRALLNCELRVVEPSKKEMLTTAYKIYGDMKVSDLWDYMNGKELLALKHLSLEEYGRVSKLSADQFTASFTPTIQTAFVRYAVVSGRDGKNYEDYTKQAIAQLHEQNNRRPEQWTKFLAFDEPVIAAKFAALRAAYDKENPYLTGHSKGWNKLLSTRIDPTYFSEGGKGLEAALDQQIVALGGVIPTAATQISTEEVILNGRAVSAQRGHNQAA